MRIEKIKLKELKQFQLSERFSRFEVLPISSLRIESYIHNPNASSNDIVLYLALEGELLIGYKSIFPDTFINNNERIKFAWLSGTWTHPDYRRQSVSLKLFNKVFKDWEGKLMYTNYAEESKAVYDKSKEFEILKSLSGCRYYIRFSLKELLPQKHSFFQKNEKILEYIDNFLNVLFDLRFKFLRKRKLIDKVEKIDNWNEEISCFLSSFKRNELFSRNTSIYEWVLKYPWVKTDFETKKESKKYYFSSYSKNFETTWYKVYNAKTKKITGIFLVAVNNKQLKIPYVYSSDDNGFLSIRESIIKLCLTHKISYFTIYNSELINSIKECKFVLWSKNFHQNYFSTKLLLQEFPEIKKLEIQSGDGDVIFV